MRFFNAPPAPVMANAPATSGLCESGLVPAVFIVGFFLTIIVVGSLIHYKAVMNTQLCEGDTIIASYNGGKWYICDKGKEAVVLEIDGKIITLRYNDGKEETIDLSDAGYKYKRASKRRWNDVSPDLTQPISPSTWRSSRGREVKYDSLRITETYHARPDPNELDKDPGVDLAIGLHLSCGIIWLCFSCYQIFMAQRGWSNDVDTRHKSHRIFGYFAAATFCCHMVGATNILIFMDLARHVSPVKAALGSDIVVSIIYIFGGIIMQKKAKKKKDEGKDEEYEKYHFIHKLLMVYGFIQSIEGSGTIRFTTWWLSAVAELLPEKLRFYVDSTQCQDNAINGVCFPITNEMQCTSSSRGDFTLAMDARTKDLSCCAPKTYAGAATFCWYSYLTRLIFMRLLTLFFKAIFLRLPDVKIWLTKVTEKGNETTGNPSKNKNESRRKIHNEFKDDLYDEYVREWTYCGLWIIGGAFYLRFNYLLPFIQGFDNAFADAAILCLSGIFFAFDTFARIALIGKHVFSDDGSAPTKLSRFIDAYLKGNYWDMLTILFPSSTIAQMKQDIMEMTQDAMLEGDELDLLMHIEGEVEKEDSLMHLQFAINAGRPEASRMEIADLYKILVKIGKNEMQKHYGSDDGSDTDDSGESAEVPVVADTGNYLAGSGHAEDNEDTNVTAAKEAVARLACATLSGSDDERRMIM